MFNITDLIVDLGTIVESGVVATETSATLDRSDNILGRDKISEDQLANIVGSKFRYYTLCYL